MQSGHKNALLITNARVIDGTGNTPCRHRSVLIKAGRIVQIEDHITANEIKIIDADGATEEYKEFDNIVGVKMLLEPGFGPIPIWPIHSENLRRIIVKEAEKRNLPIHAHAYNPREQAIALDMGVYCFAHSSFLKTAPSDEFIHRMQQKGTYLTTTLASTLEQLLVRFDLKRLDDPLLRLTVPKDQLNTARDMTAWEEMMFTQLRTASPNWIPNVMVRVMLKMVNMKKVILK